MSTYGQHGVRRLIVVSLWLTVMTLVVASLLVMATRLAQRHLGTWQQEPIELGANTNALGIIQFDLRPHFPISTEHGLITGFPAARREQVALTGLLTRELARYPASILRKTKLRSIAVCSDLRFAGQSRRGIVDFQSRVIYFDVVLCTVDNIYARTTVHHELFHLIDWLDDGELSVDSEWEAMNPPSFSYGKGGRSVQGDSTQFLMRTDLPGFLNKYGMSAVEEDKAVLYSFMVVAPHWVSRRSMLDPILHRKVNCMKQLLSKYSSAWTDEFWRRPVQE